eukprot:TRINITY_DN17986_c0_g1_i1.p1 TRINITY_DN17986_c0_g1~~TRINITY_DN17986_c0_g1_i1.p1  ORF type:complete len:516 (-),score=126.73 TRINITY_DN17986_c0_g1_i1:51-1598(-)
MSEKGAYIDKLSILKKVGIVVGSSLAVAGLYYWKNRTAQKPQELPIEPPHCDLRISEAPLLERIPEPEIELPIEVLAGVDSELVPDVGFVGGYCVHCKRSDCEWKGYCLLGCDCDAEGEYGCDYVQSESELSEEEGGSNFNEEQMWERIDQAHKRDLVKYTHKLGLSEDLRNGIEIAKLVHWEDQFSEIDPNSWSQALERVSSVLAYLREAGMNLDGIQARDIIEGNPKIIAALLYRIDEQRDYIEIFAKNPQKPLPAGIVEPDDDNWHDVWDCECDLECCDYCNLDVSMCSKVDHEDVCLMRPIPCPCKQYGCQESLPRHQMAQHVQDCRMKYVGASGQGDDNVFPCYLFSQGCDFMGSSSLDLLEHMKEGCPVWKIHCPACESVLPQSTFNDHQCCVYHLILHKSILQWPEQSEMSPQINSLLTQLQADCKDYVPNGYKIVNKYEEHAVNNRVSKELKEQRKKQIEERKKMKEELFWNSVHQVEEAEKAAIQRLQRSVRRTASMKQFHSKRYQ